MNNKRYFFFLIALAAFALAGRWLAILFWGNESTSSTFLRLLLIVGVILLSVASLVWAVRKFSHKTWIWIALLLLGTLFFPSTFFLQFTPSQEWELFSLHHALILLCLISAALIIVALLLDSGSNLLDQQGKPATPEKSPTDDQCRSTRKTAQYIFILAGVLLAKALHNLYMFMIWDATTDSLGYLWLIFIPIPAVLLAGFGLSFVLSGKRKIGGFGYALLMIALLIGVTALAQQVDYRRLTEVRAEQITRALERYHNQEGRYPEDLSFLTPGYMISLSYPEVIYGQEWCYEGRNDVYRLGYLYREHWSSPILFGQLYSSRGLSPSAGDICQFALDAYQGQ